MSVPFLVQGTFYSNIIDCNIDGMVCSGRVSIDENKLFHMLCPQVGEINCCGTAVEFRHLTDYLLVWYLFDTTRSSPKAPLLTYSRYHSLKSVGTYIRSKCNLPLHHNTLYRLQCIYFQLVIDAIASEVSTSTTIIAVIVALIDLSCFLILLSTWSVGCLLGWPCSTKVMIA